MWKFRYFPFYLIEGTCEEGLDCPIRKGVSPCGTEHSEYSQGAGMVDLTPFLSSHLIAHRIPAGKNKGGRENELIIYEVPTMFASKCLISYFPVRCLISITIHPTDEDMKPREDDRCAKFIQPVSGMAGI